MLPSRNPGAQPQAPPPGSPPASRAPVPPPRSPPDEMQAGRNRAGRGPKGVYCQSVLRSQGHLTLFTFWSTGCLHRTRRTRKLTANCTWPKAGTPKLRYRKPPRVGPTVRVSGCIEAQRPIMVPVGGEGRESGPGGSLGAPTPAAHLLGPAEASAVSLSLLAQGLQAGSPWATPGFLLSPSTKGSGNGRKHRPGPVLRGHQGAGNDIPAGGHWADGPGGEGRDARRPRRPHCHPYSPKQPHRNWKERTPQAVEGLRGARRAPHMPPYPHFLGSPSCLHPRLPDTPSPRPSCQLCLCG